MLIDTNDSLLLVLFGLPIYAILSIGHIKSIQKYYLRKIDKLNRIKSIKQAKVVSKWKWYYLTGINTKLIPLYALIRQYSGQCKPLLSVILPYHITFGCYVLHTFTQVDDFSVKSFLCLLLLVCISLLFLVTTQCASVVQYNSRIEHSYGHFYQFAVQSQTFAYFPLSVQLKEVELQTHHRLHSYAFRLFDNYRITSRTFFMVSVID